MLHMRTRHLIVTIGVTCRKVTVATISARTWPQRRQRWSRCDEQWQTSASDSMSNSTAPGSAPSGIQLVKPQPASAAVLAALEQPLILDVRDPDEVAAGKGGPPARLPGSHNVPLNHDGVGQHERQTTAEEFTAKLAEAGVQLPENRAAAIITHCGSGGRGGRAQALLQALGYTNVHNGGGPAAIAAAVSISEE